MEFDGIVTVRYDTKQLIDWLVEHVYVIRGYAQTFQPSHATLLIVRANRARFDSFFRNILCFCQ